MTFDIMQSNCEMWPISSIFLSGDFSLFGHLIFLFSQGHNIRISQVVNFCQDSKDLLILYVQCLFYFCPYFSFQTPLLLLSSLLTFHLLRNNFRIPDCPPKVTSRHTKIHFFLIYTLLFQLKFVFVYFYPNISIILHTLLLKP